jgi:hypothetical protein
MARKAHIKHKIKVYLIWKMYQSAKYREGDRSVDSTRDLYSSVWHHSVNLDLGVSALDKKNLVVPYLHGIKPTKRIKIALPQFRICFTSIQHLFSFTLYCTDIEIL